jgi:hypothetical protein
MRRAELMPKVYVVTEPPSIRGIYDTWTACHAAVAGVSGARYQSAPSRREAEAILRGESVALPVGVYAFIAGTAGCLVEDPRAIQAGRDHVLAVERTTLRPAVYALTDPVRSHRHHHTTGVAASRGAAKPKGARWVANSQTQVPRDGATAMGIQHRSR